MKRQSLVVLAAGIVLAIAGCKSNSPAPSDTVRFINGTYAIVTMQNDGDYNLVGGQKNVPGMDDAIKNMLSQQWEINSLADGMKTVNILVSDTGMHNAEFQREVKELGIDTMSEDAYKSALASLTDADQKAHVTLVHDAYKEFGDNALKGWDLGRATFLLTTFYLAKYYDENTALDKALDAAKKIQKSFKSWDQYSKSYMYGYQYWSNITTSDAKYQARAAIVKKLDDDPKSPFHVSWNTVLKKDWK